MSVARVGFATSHPFIIHRIFTCFSGRGRSLVYHRHAYIYAACAHIFVCAWAYSIIHAPLPRSRRWHLVGPGPKSPLAKYEKRLVSQYQFRRKNQMSLKCRPGLSYIPLFLSFYLSIPATHTCQPSISIQCCGLTVSVSLSNLRNDSERKMSTMPKTHNKGRICDENRKQKWKQRERMYGGE